MSYPGANAKRRREQQAMAIRQGRQGIVQQRVVYQQPMVVPQRVIYQQRPQYAVPVQRPIMYQAPQQVIYQQQPAMAVRVQNPVQPVQPVYVQQQQQVPISRYNQMQAQKYQNPQGPQRMVPQIPPQAVQPQTCPQQSSFASNANAMNSGHRMNANGNGNQGLRARPVQYQQGQSQQVVPVQHQGQQQLMQPGQGMQRANPVESKEDDEGYEIAVPSAPPPPEYLYPDLDNTNPHYRSR